MFSVSCKLLLYGSASCSSWCGYNKPRVMFILLCQLQVLGLWLDIQQRLVCLTIVNDVVFILCSVSGSTGYLGLEYPAAFGMTSWCE